MRKVFVEDLEEGILPESFPVKCITCKKTPKNCRCFEYRLEPANDEISIVNVFVDNVATDAVRGEPVGLWQARRNAKIFRRPQYIDGFGPVLTIDLKDVEEIERAIRNKTFFLDNYVDREGFNVKNIDKNLRRRLPFLRRPRKKRIAASRSGFISCT